MPKLVEFIRNISGWQWLIIIGGILLIAIMIGIPVVRKRKHTHKQESDRGRADGIPHTEIPEAGGGSIVIGKVHEQGARDYQEDSFSVSPEEMYNTKGLLAVLADGMGGLGGGDKVSQTAVTAIMNQFYVQQSDGIYLLLELVGRANDAVNRMLGLNNIGKSGSTLAVGYVKEGKFYYLNIGDSRICLYRGGVLYQLNRDHNFRNELSLRAINGDGTLEDAWSHPKAAGLTSFLGMGQLKYIDIPAEPVSVLPKDMFILMSDGVYNAISSEELCECLQLDAAEAAEAIHRLVEEKAWPGQDNYTAILLQCLGNEG